MSPPPEENPTLLAVDLGTTNTRAWLCAGDVVLARRQAAVGARDTAREGGSDRLRSALAGLLGALLRERPREVAGPSRVAASGMITSPQGLLEVPHVPAPAGLAEIAGGAREVELADVCPLPFVLVPGVRTGRRPGAPEGVGATDVMRGEETLGLGLLRTGGLIPGSALLNVGSHWKLVQVDEAGRLAWSLTSLAGEMVHAVRRETILASALAEGPLADPDRTLLLEGMAEGRRSGLPRALFCVRLLELSGRGTPYGRLSFLAGAFVGAELASLQASGALSPRTPVTVCGDDKVGGAWALALGREGHPVRSLGPDEVEAGFLAGLRAVVEERRRRALSAS